MARPYRLEPKTQGAQWDAFVRASPDGTVFSHSTYLEHTGRRLGLYGCYHGQELRAVVAVIESADGASAELDDMVIYGGLCFGPSMSGQNRAQCVSERFEVATFVADALASRYRDLAFALAPSITDVRPFLWHNYGTAGERYRVDVRYTSFVDIGDFARADSLEEIGLYAQCTGARRQQIRYARRDGVVTEEIDDVGMFADFYRRTLERQGTTVPTSTLERMASLVAALLSHGMARMFVARTRTGEAGSVAVYALDARRAYYLYGANDPALRDTPTGTAVLWDAFAKLAGSGVTEVDLEGVNSPRRGWFKLSFGGDLRPYYQIEKECTS